MLAEKFQLNSVAKQSGVGVGLREPDRGTLPAQRELPTNGLPRLAFTRENYRMMREEKPRKWSAKGPLPEAGLGRLSGKRRKCTPVAPRPKATRLTHFRSGVCIAIG
jgi:hypothetical protein